MRALRNNVPYVTLHAAIFSSVKSRHCTKCTANVSCMVLHSKEQALKELASAKETNRTTVDKLMAKAKQTAEENTNTRAEVEATAKASKEEVARLHKMISQQRKMVEEQKKMITRLTAAKAPAAAAPAISNTPPATKKRTADDAKIPPHSPGDGVGSAEKKARKIVPSSPAAGKQAPGGGDKANPLLAFLIRREKAGTLTQQQKQQLETMR